MIGNSSWEYIFIRASILLLRYIVLLAAFFCVLLFAIRPASHSTLVVLDIWAIAELFFLLFVYYPKDLEIQRAASHPKVLSREKREELFQRCSDTIEDPERYLSLWHRGAPSAEIKRENVKGICRIFACKPSS